MLDYFENTRNLLESHLMAFETCYKETMSSKKKLLDHVLKYLTRQKGKQVRPLFVMLSAGMIGDINEKTYRGATMVELLHQATLIHDDVVDDSYQRRGVFTINAIWKNKVSVLTGDYLLAKGMLLALRNHDIEMLDIVSKTVEMMSEGELLQAEKSRNLKIDEETYFEIIRMKTASLIGTCCAVGAVSAGASKSDVDAMWNLGEKTGLIFQIKDDLLDYSLGKTGKKAGADFREKKMTLPLLFALRNAEKEKRKAVIKSVRKKTKSESDFKNIVGFIDTHGGFDYASGVMKRIFNESQQILDNFQDSVFKNSFRNLMQYSMERNK